MTQTEKVRVKKLILYSILAVLIGFAVYGIYRLTGFGLKCVLYELTSLKCPGCGNTHAVSELLSLNIKDALSHNYLFPLEFSYISYVYILSSKEYIKNGHFTYKTPCKVIDIIVLVLIILWFPVRNILSV